MNAIQQAKDILKKYNIIVTESNLKNEKENINNPQKIHIQYEIKILRKTLKRV